MRLAALIKQIPAFEEMTLGDDGRLVREGIELEMNAYCRRAVSKACELAAERPGSLVTVMTLGPPSAEDVLREAIAWGTSGGIEIDGVLATDPAFAGSDTLATAKALAALIERLGPFDLILTGRNSVDADTGQVPAELAELLDLPFATSVKHLELEDDLLRLGCEHDDGWVDCEIRLPALLSCAERLCEPSKVAPEGRADVPAERITRVSAADLGPGPWGSTASRTIVGPTRLHEVDRAREVHPDLPLRGQVSRAVELLVERGALSTNHSTAPLLHVSDATGADGPVVAVIGEPDRAHATDELLGTGAELAGTIGGATALVTTESIDAGHWGGAGADHLVTIEGAPAEEDVAAAVAAWAGTNDPWAVLTGSTVWGREVASRVAARLNAGLTGDAVALEVDSENRLVAWKPAFGGQLVAAITATSRVQMATVRAGVLPARTPRRHEPTREEITVTPRHRVTITSRRRDDDIEVLADASAVIGIGQGVEPSRYHELEPLRQLLGAELGATRKVTDQGWMPRSRQIGITGRSIAPRLYVMISASGKFNHSVGVRGAGTVLAINSDPHALAWDHADIGIVGSWDDAVPMLVDALSAVVSANARS